MAARHAVVLALVSACADASGYAGDYESVQFAREQAGCTGALQDEPVPANDRYFRLGDVEVDGGMLVAYYACTAVDQCDDLYDLTRSFGAAKDGDTEWAGYLATAIPGATCTLTYRVRRLSRAGDGRLHVDTEVFRDTDDTLMGAACDRAVASERGAAMPCIEQSQLVAEDR